MKIIEILNIEKALKDFTSKEIALPYTITRCLVKNIKLFEEEIKIFEEQRNKLAEDFDNKTDDEKKALEEKFQNLLQTEVEIDLLKFDENLLDTADIKLTIKDMALLEKFFND